VPNVYTTTTTLTLLIEKALNREADWAFREMPTFRMMVDKNVGTLTNPGQPAKLVINNDLALATTALTENVDPDSVALPAPTVITVSPLEYGNATLRTLKMQELVYTNVVPDIAQTVGRNMIDSVDKLYQNVFDTGAHITTKENALYLHTGNNVDAIKTTDFLDANGAARVAAIMRTRLALPRVDGLWRAIIHPNIAYDLKRESGASANTVNSWFYAHANAGDAGPIYRGELGTFVGVRWFENAKCTKITNANSPTASVYTSYFMGQQPLVEYVSIEPRIVVGEVTDKLRRFYPVGWYCMLNSALYRTEALELVKTSSTLQ
jgi:N4-gp56 family major capsid protein